MELTPRQHEYWQRNLRITAALLLVWALVTFVPVWFAQGLNTVSVFGWPLAFYIGAQGALIIYVVVIWSYARMMDRLDRDYGVGEES